MSNEYKKTLERFEIALTAYAIRDQASAATRKVIEREYEAARRALVAKLQYRQRPDYPTEDAYLRACRANHWRTAQLRAHGIEPFDLSTWPDAPQYPPDDYQWRHGPTRLVTHKDVQDVAHDILVSAQAVLPLEEAEIDRIAEDIADQLVPSA